MANFKDEKYVPGQAVTQAQQNLAQFQQNKPGEYQSQYQNQMNNLLQQYQQRPAFSYDVNADALFQQAAQRTMQQGQQAMMDTMGQASAMTGGYGNSYAQTAGQQTYNGMIQGLYDKLPQYYQMAADQYDRQGSSLLQQYGMVSDLEQQAYGRYQDAMDRYYQELNRLQGVYDSERSYDYNVFADQRTFDWNRYTDEADREYRANRDAVADSQWNQSFQYQQQRDQAADDKWAQQFAYQQNRDSVADNQWQQSFQYQQNRDAVADSQWNQKFQYQQDRDAVADSQWQTQWDYAKEQDALENGRYDQKLAQAQVDAMLAMGADIPPELLAAAGYSQAYVDAMKAGVVTAGGGGGGGGSTAGSTNLGDKTGFQIASNELGAALSQARQQGGTISQQNIENYITGMYKAGVIDANEAQGLRDIWA